MAPNFKNDMGYDFMGLGNGMRLHRMMNERNMEMNPRSTDVLYQRNSAVEKRAVVMTMCVVGKERVVQRI